MCYAKEGKFPYGQLDEISTVGIIAKQGEKYAKSSVDWILGVKCKESKRDLLLLEFKSRVKQKTEQKEQDRVKRLIRKGLMREDDIFLELDDTDEHSMRHIVKSTLSGTLTYDTTTTTEPKRATSRDRRKEKGSKLRGFHLSLKKFSCKHGVSQDQ